MSIPGPPSTVDLSVVVAAPQAGRNLGRCLSALQAEPSDGAREILVAYASGSESSAWPEREFPEIRFLRLPVGTSAPKLWKAGIEASCGTIIALTVEQCAPTGPWAAHILRAHSAKSPAVGGAIDLARDTTLVDSAVYFCRYSAYMPSYSAKLLEDLPGDNCSYKRTALDELGAEWTEGFWETFINRKLRDRGKELLWLPEIRMDYVGGTGWADFLKTRFSHGRYFAWRRGRGMVWWLRLLRASFFAVVPLLMLSRIAGRVFASRQHRGRFLAALPVLVSFLVAWSSGELIGYLFGRPSEDIDTEAQGRVLGEAT